MSDSELIRVVRRVIADGRPREGVALIDRGELSTYRKRLDGARVRREALDIVSRDIKPECAKPAGGATHTACWYAAVEDPSLNVVVNWCRVCTEAFEAACFVLESRRAP